MSEHLASMKRRIKACVQQQQEEVLIPLAFKNK
jgi:hypothetical protein